jgi:F-type H+-transporting ATPase subunit b
MRVKYIYPLFFLVLVLGGFSLAATVPVTWAASSHGDAQAMTATASEHAPADSHAAVDTGHGTSTEAHGEAAGGHGEGGHQAKSITPAKLKDFFWRTVNFIALLAILIYFLARPIGNALAGRRQNVIDEIKALETKRDEAERSYKEFESRLAGMEKEMETVVERAIAQAENEKAKILEDAEKAAEDIKRQAQATIQAELVEARRSLRDEIADQAAAMAEELIIKNLKPEDQVKITEQYLDRVGAVQ